MVPKCSRCDVEYKRDGDEHCLRIKELEAEKGELIKELEAAGVRIRTLKADVFALEGCLYCNKKNNRLCEACACA